jgi:hypothetical protein
MWANMEEMLNDASALQYPSFFENLSALQFRGQILQALSSSSGLSSSA